jgi:WXG100 family type VII secretion target
MANLGTDHQGMHSAGLRLEQTLSVTNTHLNSVRNEIDQLRATWLGGASKKFADSMGAWETQCNEITKQLGDMVRLMQGNRNVIIQSEDTNTDIAAAAGLPGL